ncbi:flagellar hook-associated protein FlgK [Xylophilus sp. GOD-11R]|uniref:flagellar hook-associated protein FlgK n=1 Tax=Xylophilus sp. GOD-11R TaxID=3089814 RepID=UPI00298BF36C|nr:flagellar hook-associated protein FlgK [Xylophilus sp. GOD-11R]WPB57734.1 flagellar hook-associated protein FlgK [Xylophilus sp. GOD-11R]
MSLLNVSARALTANQTALQTIGHNISNVNTAGYSKQTVQLESAGGQYTGAGYIGRGVSVATITRAHDQFLTKQATLATSVAASDSARSASLLQLEDVFPGGATGLGASVTDMLNAFTDVSAAPSDLTARSVVLTRASEMTGRFNTASSQLDELQTTTQQKLKDDVTAVNGLVTRIAAVNQQIAVAFGSAQQPNDLLDQRDSLVKDLNKYVQTTQVAADDGTTNVFLGSQALVLGTTTATVSMVSDPNGDPSVMKLSIGRPGTLGTTLDENQLGGGEVAGLLRFNNTDLAEGRNLLGRIAVATTTTINDQHKLGLDLDGNTGGNLLNPISMPAGYPAAANTGSASVGVSVTDVSKLAASDYRVTMNSGTVGSVTRLSDGQVTNFDLASGQPTVDGLTFAVGAGAASGDTFTVKPFASAASQMATVFSSARQLAVTSPVVATAAADNTGSVTVQGLLAVSQNPALTSDAVINFTSPTSYTVTVPPAAAGPAQTYTSGQKLSFNGWELSLKGVPAAGDVVMVQANDSSIGTPMRAAGTWPNTYSATPATTVGGPVTTTAGNADAMAALRDKTVYDGSALSDGYAGLMSEIGTRVQGAQFTASVSANISASLDSSASSVSGVNLDEEAAKLLQYQQAYQASAKMIQVAQSLFDSVIGAMR